MAEPRAVRPRRAQSPGGSWEDRSAYTQPAAFTRTGACMYTHTTASSPRSLCGCCQACAGLPQPGGGCGVVEGLGLAVDEVPAGDALDLG